MNQLNYKEILHSDYLEKITGWAINRTRDYGRAEDLAQEVVTELYLVLSNNPKIDNFPAWVWSIARYTYYRWLRKWNANHSLDTMVIMNCEEIDEALLQAEELQLLRREISFLSKSHRETIIYYYFYGKSCNEIAELLGVSSGTIKWRLFDARNQLKRGMGEMRNYGERSFNPGRFVVGVNGRWGNDGSPFRFLKNTRIC